MEMVYQRNNCKLITHDRSIQNYKASSGSYTRYQLNQILFYNFKRKQKVNNRNDEEQCQEIMRINEFLRECKQINLFGTYNESDIDTYKKENIDLMNRFYSLSSEFNEFYGENNLEYGNIITVNESQYLIPPQCKFFNKPVEKIKDFLSPNEKFDFIVVDPPWKSRYIKRLNKTFNKKSYNMLSDDEILSIPVENYIHQSSLIVIWCTNAQSHENFIMKKVLQKWNLKLIAMWKWVKIDKCGNTFCSFEGSKKPFEKIFIATYVNNLSLENFIPKELLLFSQPSSIHSHKPLLLDLFRHILPFKPKCLELFARSLYENFTSVGMEVVKLQNIMLFEEAS